MPENKFWGLIPDPYDSRDLLQNDVAPLNKIIQGIEVPSEFRSDDFSTSMIMNQGQTPMCIGYTGALLLKMWKTTYGISLPNSFREVDPKKIPQNIYHKSREFYSYSDQIKEGSTLRSLMKFFHITGLVQRYFKVLKDEDLIPVLKTLIITLQIVPISFRNMRWENRIARYDEGSLTAHGGNIIGWTDRDFIFPNSWGKRSGDKGVWYVPFEEAEKGFLTAWGYSPTI